MALQFITRRSCKTCLTSYHTLYIMHHLNVKVMSAAPGQLSCLWVALEGLKHLIQFTSCRLAEHRYSLVSFCIFMRICEVQICWSCFYQIFKHRLLSFGGIVELGFVHFEAGHCIINNLCLNLIFFCLNSQLSALL